ncbi:MAG: hypothetical protein M0Q43_03660 [Methanothrix sp.]|jgi:hypothetical protein|nr:hypothetical protein [Methanothrix sp.]
MKDFAGSSITYYGLAREKLMNKYPRLISVLVILALICTTGLAIFLISDLVSFASNPDHKGVSAGLDLKGPENSIVTMTAGEEKSGNIGTNSSSDNLSSQSKGQNVANLSKINASLPSGQGVAAASTASKSSSSSSRNSVDKSGNPAATKHHSSSSSSSSSSAKSAKKSSDKNNLTNETITSPTLTNQSIDISQGNESGFVNATSNVDLPPIDAAKSAIENSSNLSSEGQISVPSDQESANSQRPIESEVAPTAIPASLPSVDIGSLTNPDKDTSAREPVSIIKFKTEATLSPKSEQGQNPDNSINTDSATISKDTTKKTNSKAIGTKSASSQKSKVTASSQAKKVQEAKAKLKASRDRVSASMKKKAAQLRSKAAPN